MTVRLCAGSAEEAITRGCVEIGGARATYFGADQPRITAEALIPWSALRVGPPAPGTPLQAEMAVTSWHRERWMSLSGRPPSETMNDPKGWKRMRLGNGPQIIETYPAHLLAPG
ncbi:MAG: hypothetical protein JOY83_04950 [Alphaproteobacteria bacterium]|nr:hypothetical protein [Alphaproteobacteria bacterium]